jgi:hypothetical protein
MFTIDSISATSEVKIETARFSQREILQLTDKTLQEERFLVQGVDARAVQWLQAVLNRFERATQVGGGTIGVRSGRPCTPRCGIRSRN